LHRELQHPVVEIVQGFWAQGVLYRMSVALVGTL
jgi:hypothetical protein